VRIDDLLSRKRPSFSFEFMAPRSDGEVGALFETIADLARLNPDFVCVTCRPSSRDRTIDLTIAIRQRLGLVAMAHVICVGETRSGIEETLGRLSSGGVENVLALRGDVPAGQGAGALSNDLKHSTDLLKVVAGLGDFCAGGACYPEVHPESADLDEDLDRAVLKVKSGATFLITQLFLENSTYFRFVEGAARRGVDVPILPGIMPITHFAQLARIKTMGVSVPPKLEAMMLRYRENPDAIREFGIAWASLQCAELLERGAPGIHFYTFNRSPATRALYGAIRATVFSPLPDRRSTSANFGRGRSSASPDARFP
jgi:methylenetetrahydrofolate reductase (NADPH)